MNGSFKSGPPPKAIITDPWFGHTQQPSAAYPDIFKRSVMLLCGPNAMKRHEWSEKSAQRRSRKLPYHVVSATPAYEVATGQKACSKA